MVGMRRAGRSGMRTNGNFGRFRRRANAGDSWRAERTFPEGCRSDMREKLKVCCFAAQPRLRRLHGFEIDTGGMLREWTEGPWSVTAATQFPHHEALEAEQKRRLTSRRVDLPEGGNRDLEPGCTE